MAVTKEEVVEFISNMTVLELSEFIKELEEKFGVSAAAMAAKNITEHRENVVHRHSAAKSAERSTVSGCSAHSCMTKLVVAGTFIRVAQYVVGFGCFFKLFFRFLVTRIFVRMILDGFFPVCFLYFFDC